MALEVLPVRKRTATMSFLRHIDWHQTALVLSVVPNRLEGFDLGVEEVLQGIGMFFKLVQQCCNEVVKALLILPYHRASWPSLFPPTPREYVSLIHRSICGKEDMVFVFDSRLHGESWARCYRWFLKRSVSTSGVERVQTCRGGRRYLYIRASKVRA
jgi:hypothetical protein